MLDDRKNKETLETLVASRVAWTQERVDLLRRLAGSGLSNVDIAAEFGCTEFAVATRLSTLQIRARLTWMQRERIGELHAEGWRPSRISRQLSIDQIDVERVIAAGSTRRSASA